MTIRKMISAIVLTELVIVLIAIIMNGITIEALQTATRFSGRFSLLVFSCIFLLHAYPQTLHSILSKQFYLALAVAHGIHFAELGSYIFLSGVKLIPYRLLGGALAYALIMLMPFIQSLREREKIQSSTFSKFETGFAYYLWLIFFLTYLPRLTGSLPSAGGYYYEFVILMSWVVIMLPLRFIGVSKITSLIKA